MNTQESYQRVKEYYAGFDEWRRLDSPSGQLEMNEVLHLISSQVEQGSHIFEFGIGSRKVCSGACQEGVYGYFG